MLHPSLADFNSGRAQDDHAAMRGEVSHSSGGKEIDQDRKRSQNDGVGRANASEKVRDASGGKKLDQHCRAAGRKNGSPDVRDGAREHRAGVHVCYSCGWGHRKAVVSSQ